MRNFLVPVLVIVGIAVVAGLILIVEDPAITSADIAAARYWCNPDGFAFVSSDGGPAMPGDPASSLVCQSYSTGERRSGP